MRAPWLRTALGWSLYIVAGASSTSTGFRRLLVGTLRPGAMLVSAAASTVERSVVEPAVRRATPRALALLDQILDAPLTEEAVNRIASSELLHRGVERALAGPVGDAVADAVSEHEVIERIVSRLAASGELDRLVDGALSSETSDAIAEQAVTRLLESDYLWQLVDEIARSPSVTAAISRQGLGLADQFAAVVRERSLRADTRVEHAARRLRRRNGDQQEPLSDPST